MSSPVESGGNRTPWTETYRRAIEAVDQGDLEHGNYLCLMLLKESEELGDEHKTATAYHLLGKISYREGNLEDAESWYREALAIDLLTGDEAGAANTLNNLSAVANERQDYDRAEELLWKSISIKQRLADKLGLKASYHQLGVVAESQAKLDAAEKWYLKANAVAEELGDQIGMAKSSLSLCGIAERREDDASARDWRLKAIQALGRAGDAEAAIKLARQLVERGHSGDARVFLHKALDISIEYGDRQGQSLCHLQLANLDCELGDFEAAKINYEKSIELDSSSDLQDRAATSCVSLGKLYLMRINGKPRDFGVAKTWFQRSLELKRQVSWLDFLSVNSCFWYNRLLSLLRI